jgi:hypothetical protein
MLFTDEETRLKEVKNLPENWGWNQSSDSRAV